MLTLQDCLDHCDVNDDLCNDVAQIIASHEHLSFVVAIEKAYAFMNCDWGRPAIRQMIHDEIVKARRCGRMDEAARLESLRAEFARVYPGGRDRRLAAWRQSKGQAGQTARVFA